MRGCVLRMSWWWSLPRGVRGLGLQPQCPGPLSVLCVLLYFLTLEHISSTSVLTDIKRDVSHS